MQITTKTEYAIRALTELAHITDSNPLTIREICERQNLPVKYTEQLFRKLRKSGIVVGFKGATGGYLLKVSPENLSLKEILLAVEDGFSTLSCTDEKGARNYCIGQPCNFYAVWQEIRADIDDYLDNIKLTKFMGS